MERYLNADVQNVDIYLFPVLENDPWELAEAFIGDGLMMVVGTYSFLAS